jgi:hypothetical protein
MAREVALHRAVEDWWWLVSAAVFGSAFWRLYECEVRLQHAFRMFEFGDARHW